MKTPALIVSALLVVGSAMADPYVISKQRARQTSGQNDAEQQRIQKATGDAASKSSAAPATPAAAPAPMDPALQATLNNINGLQGDFTTLNTATGDKPDTTQKMSLLNNLSAAAQSKKASSDSIKKLGDDLWTAVSGKKKLAAAQQKKLAVDVHALFNSSHLSAAQQKMMLDDVQKIFTDAGTPLDDATNVVTDLKKIADETK
jgi:hypothetical protein